MKAFGSDRSPIGWSGEPRPKQFCPVLGSSPPLIETLRRAALSAPADQQEWSLPPTAARYWAPMIDRIAPGRLLVQPDNRGTAAALLIAFLTVRARAGNAPVVVLPSDHHVSDDAVFMAHVDAALGVTRSLTTSTTPPN